MRLLGRLQQQQRSICFVIFQLFLFFSSNNINTNKNYGNGVWAASSSFASSSSDPYKILGVTPTTNQEEIKKRYRELCLKYHPDKNVHKSSKEQEEYETIFKTIQKANSLIGNQQSRKEYDRMRLSPFYRPDLSSSTGFSPATTSSSSSSSPFSTSSAYDDLFRAFGMSHTRPSSSSSGGASPNSFYFQTGPLFGNRQFSSPLFSPMSNTNGLSNLKSTYIQKVKIPLQDLYTGVSNFEFVIYDNWWKRYRAAFRGGAVILNLYQALMYGLPLLRLSKYVALATAITIFHKTLPRPSKQKSYYKATLLPGYKGGKTKLAFRSTGFSDPEVIIELEEEHHERYIRQENNLHTSITITPHQARKGCIIPIQPLDEEEPIIYVTLLPHQIRESGDEIVIRGRGWPIRGSSNNNNNNNNNKRGNDNDEHNMEAGDLVVRVLVEKIPPKNKRRHRTKMS